jgi:hypothetical protein
MGLLNFLFSGGEQDSGEPDLMAEAYEAEAAELNDGTLLTSLDPAAYQYVSTDYLLGDVSDADVLAGYLSL